MLFCIGGKIPELPTDGLLYLSSRSPFHLNGLNCFDDVNGFDGVESLNGFDGVKGVKADWFLRGGDL